MSITYRKDLDRPLTADEVDENFKVLEDSEKNKVSIGLTLTKDQDRKGEFYKLFLKDVGEITRISCNTFCVSSHTVAALGAYKVIDFDYDENGDFIGTITVAGGYDMGCNLDLVLVGSTHEDYAIVFTLQTVEKGDDYPDSEKVKGEAQIYLF